MTNAITSTTQDVDGYTTSDFRTEDQWLGEVNAHKSKRKELVRLWFVNKFGSQSKLAKHLGCDRSTVTADVDKLLATGELTEEHYQKKMCNSRKPKQTGGKSTEPVENSTTQTSTLSPETDDNHSLVQPTTERQLDGLPSNSEALQSLLPGVVSYTEGCDTRSLSMEQGPNSSDDATGNRVLAEHYIQVQATGSCDSYKQAEYHFSCFLELLGRSVRDGWTEREYSNLSQDLAGATKLCTNASQSYREVNT